jgi:hypothetical protein
MSPQTYDQGYTPKNRKPRRNRPASPAPTATAEVVPQVAPVAFDLKAVMTARLNERVRYFPQVTVETAPVTTAHLAVSQMPSEFLKVIAPAIQSAYEFVASKDQLASQPGALSNLRAGLLTLPVDARNNAMSVLAWAQALPPDSQEAVLQLVQASQSPPEMIGGRQVTAQIRVARTLAVHQAFIDGLPDDQRTALYAVLGYQPGDLAKFVENVGTLAGPLLTTINPFTYIAAASHIPGLDSLQTVADTGNKAFSVAAKGVEELVAVPYEAISAVQGHETHWSDTLRFWDASHHDPLTIATFDMSGEDINAPENQRLASALDAVSQLGAGLALARGIGDVTTMLKTPVEMGGFRNAEGFLDTHTGNRFVDTAQRVMDQVPEIERAAAITDATRNVSPVLAQQMADGYSAGGVEGLKRGFIDYVEDVPTDARLAEASAKVRTIDDKLADPNLDLAQEPFWQGERMRAVRELSYLTDKSGQYRWPESHRVVGVLKGAPATSIPSRVVEAFYEPKGIGQLLKLADDLPRQGELYGPTDPLGPNKPADWAERNVDTIGKFGRAAGIKPSVLRTRVGEMLRISSRQEWFAWMKRFGDDIADAARGKVPPDVLARVTTFFRNPAETVVRSPLTEDVTTPSGAVVPRTGNVLEDRTGRAVPSQENEFLGNFRTPDMQSVKEVTSWVRELERRRLVGFPLRLVKNVFRISTGIAKPIWLDTKQLPILLKTQVDQALRNIVFGYKAVAPISRTVAVLRDHGYETLPGGVPVDAAAARGVASTLVKAEDVSPAELGSLFSETQTEPMMSVPLSTADYAARDYNSIPEKTSYEVFRSFHDELMHLNASRTARSVAEVGPEVTLQRMQIPGTALNTFFERDMKPLLEEHGIDPLEWLKAKERQIDQVTGGNARIRAAISTNKVYTANGETAVASDQVALYNDKAAELVDINSAIADARARGDVNTTSSLYLRRRDIIDELQKMEARTNGSEYIALKDSSAVIEHMQNGYRTGDYQLPPRYLKKVPASILSEGDGTAIRNSAMRKYTTIMYKGLRPMSWADLKLTRGSLFFQEFNRVLPRLIESGWPKERAIAEATARAGYVTRDLMYDLSARTSVQRDVANIFPFAPAWQEGLVTWLYKAPSHIGNWPIGATFLYHQLASMADLLKATGHLTTIPQPDGTSETVLLLPNPLRLFDSLPGLHDVPNLITMNPANLSIVARGLPTAGPALSFTLGHAAQYAPALQGLNDLVNAYGFDFPGVQLATKVYEAATGSAPPWAVGASGKWQQYVVDRAHDRALQYAYNDLVKEGIKPPNPAGMSEAGYNAARDDYWNKLDAAAASYEHGISFTYLMGYLVGPTSYTPTTTEELAWKKFLSAAGISGKRSEADYALIDKYLGDHPDSLAYSVSMYGVRGNRPKPNATTADDFAKAVAAGDLFALNPKEYAAKMALQQEYSYLNEAKAEALHRAGLSNWDTLSAADQIKLRGQYADATRAAYDNFDRFLDDNPAAKRYYDAHQDTISSDDQATFDQIHRLEDHRQTALAAGASPDEYDAAVRVLYSTLHEGKPARWGKDTSQQKAWYRDVVVNSYYTKVDAIWKDLNAAKARGEDVSKFYNRLRDLANKENPVTRGDQTFPTPEEYTYQGKTAREQELAKQHWANLPPAYLTDFQYQTTYGVHPGPQVQTYWEYRASVEDAFTEGVKGLSTSSKEYDSWQAWESNALKAGAAKIGPEAEQVYRLENLTPIERMAKANVIPKTDNMAWIVQQTAAVAARIIAKGYSIRGSSDFAVYEKKFLETYIAQMRDPTSDYYDRHVDQFFTRLGVENQLEDAPLYEKVLFGASPTISITSPELVRAVEKAS